MHLFRDLQRSYLDVLTWLIRMESSVTTDDANEAALINDVLKKTSLLNHVCYSNMRFISIPMIQLSLGFVSRLYSIAYNQNTACSSCNTSTTDEVRMYAGDLSLYGTVKSYWINLSPTCHGYWTIFQFNHAVSFPTFTKNHWHCKGREDSIRSYDRLIFL